MMKRPGWHLGRNLMIVLTLSLLLCGCTCDVQEALFQDDFENVSSGWGSDRRDGFDRGYDEGVYFFDLWASNWLAWASSGNKGFENVSIEVDARVASGAQDGHYGVLCRYEDAESFYYFAVSADGYYAIFRREESGLKILTGDGSGMLPSAHIKTGKQVNHVLGVCDGDELSLYVNGQFLESVTDETYTQGDVGVGASSGPGGTARIVFDNFVVTAP
jgi:hypothetical protein